MVYFKKILLFIGILSLSQNLSAQIKSAPMLTMDSSLQGLSKAPEASGSFQKGGRTRESISEVVNLKVKTLKKLYDKRLIKKPNLEGEVKTKFAIDEFGKVILSEIAESSVKDSIFENEILKEVNSWVFSKVDKPGDVTEVLYPFVFKKDYSKVILSTVAGLFTIALSILFISKINRM